MSCLMLLWVCSVLFFFFKQKTAYDMRISDWSSDVCSSDLAWVKAIKVLPKNSVFHKQDWFIDSRYKADLTKDDTSFLSRSSERFFNERPYLDHSCYIYLDLKQAGRQLSSSMFSNLLRRTIVPEPDRKSHRLKSHH